MFKLLKWIVLGVVVLIIVIVVAVFMAINGIVRKGVEVAATDSLNLQTTLGSANLSLLGGSLSLNDLEIASPQGFESPRMFTLGGVKTGVSFSELKKDPIGINQIVIDKPKLVVEQSGGKLNFQVLMDRPSKEPPDSGKPGDGQREPGEPIRLVIHDLQLNNATVVLRPGIPGLQKEINVTVPSLQMKDIGSGEGNKNGVAIKTVIAEVISALAKKASESNDVPPEVRQLLSLNADQVKQRLASELNKETGKLQEQIEKKLGQEATDSLQKNLGGLLRGSRQPTTR